MVQLYIICIYAFPNSFPIRLPGMVFSVEPGLYVEGLGAFRHSDTIVITENGMEKITYYPRDLNSLIIG